MAYTEFYCNPAGSNLNSGSSTGTTATYTCTNSNWDGTSVFTPTDGSTPASTVNVGDFASVFLDAATVAVYVARVTNVAAGVNGAITLSTTAKSGTAPTSGATGRTIKVGGCWKGPNGTEKFPWDFITNALENASSDVPRVNFLGGTNYNVTGAMTHSLSGLVRFQGYTASVGDGGKATIDGGVAGVSYNLFALSNSNCDLIDFIFQNNGATGSADGVTVSGAETFIDRVVVNSVRGRGFVISGASCTLSECETYACNQSNTSALAGMQFSAATLSTYAVRCISHDNSGSNAMGFRITGDATLDSCIADTNGNVGFEITTGGMTVLTECDAYNNTSHGINLNNAGAAHFYIENCNLVKNGASGTVYGINGAGAGARNGIIRNCAFGAGTQANFSGQTNALSGMSVVGSITLTTNTTPWVDPANGDFRINSADVKGLGRGTFTQTAASYSGTVAYPDVGAAQHQDAGGAAGALLKSGGMTGGMQRE